MRRRTAAALVLAGLLLAACGGTSTGSSSSTGPKQGGTLTTAIGIDPDTLDPQAQTTTTSSQLVQMMTEGLVGIDRQGHTKPVLATQWQASQDGLTYTFTLRQGVKFSDGEPFDAQAVKFTFDRLLSPATLKAQVGVLKVIKQTDAVDASHVRFTLNEPFAAFPSALSQSVASIVAPNSVNQAPNTPATVAQPVGTGPYVFKERVKGDHITMTRNPNYWGQKPSYQAQTYKIVPEAASRESLIKAGQADVAMLPPPNDLPALQANPDVSVMLGDSDRTIFVAIDTQDPRVPALQKKEVRQALNYAVNKQAIIKNVLFGAGSVSNAPAASTLFGYCQSGSYGYNPNKAKQMLQQAGAEGLGITLGSPQGRYIGDYQVTQAVAGDLRAVGLKVNMPNPPDWPSYVAANNLPANQVPWNMHLLGWAPTYLDASQALTIFQKANFPPAGSDTSWYDRTDVGQLIAKGNADADPVQRRQAYCQAEKTIWDDAPLIFLHTQKLPVVTTKKVSGVVTLPNEQFSTVNAAPAST